MDFDKTKIIVSCLKATGIDEIKKIICSSLQRTDRKKYKLSAFSHIITLCLEDMTYKEAEFDSLVNAAVNASFQGWDFSWLKGRKTEYDLPWDYKARVRRRMQGISSMLDMGTGGGEILASLAPFPPGVCATEAYPPNIAVSRKRLEPLGVKVCDTSSDPGNRHLPFKDEAFDLVINRHESYVPAEVSRILKPGAYFITQQCGGFGQVDLIEYFKGKIEPMDWTVEVASGQLQNAGFKILDSQEVYPQFSFLDVGAVVYYLRAIPWLLEDFTVEKYRDRLLAMHDHIHKLGRFTVKDQLFFIEAAKQRQLLKSNWNR